MAAAMATAMAEVLTAVPGPDARTDAAPAGTDRDRLAAMLASVGECRSAAPPGGPTSAEPPGATRHAHHARERGEPGRRDA